MLTLTRKQSEAIVIQVPGLDEPIVIALTDIRKNQVRLGVIAPTDCVILREELTWPQGVIAQGIPQNHWHCRCAGFRGDKFGLRSGHYCRACKTRRPQ